MDAFTKKEQELLTPKMAEALLMDGNKRFVDQNMATRNLNKQISQTSSGQYPFAIVLGCIDSRVSNELIFDQGIGDIFSARVAGNIINDDILGSMEFSCKVAGSKVIMVLGHTSCGAVKGACDDVKLGNLTTLLSKIQPAVNAEKETTENRTSSNIDFVNNVAQINVKLTMDNIRNHSSVLREMEENKEISIVGAMYDVNTGKVNLI